MLDATRELSGKIILLHIDQGLGDTIQFVRYIPFLVQQGARVVLESLTAGQSMPELTLTSPTAPGVTHRWANLDDFTQEVANARVWAGFHYRFSTRVGTALGGRVAQYVVNNSMQPITRTVAR